MARSASAAHGVSCAWCGRHGMASRLSKLEPLCWQPGPVRLTRPCSVPLAGAHSACCIKLTLHTPAECRPIPVQVAPQECT